MSDVRCSTDASLGVCALPALFAKIRSCIRSRVYFVLVHDSECACCMVCCTIDATLLYSGTWSKYSEHLACRRLLCCYSVVKVLAYRSFEHVAFGGETQKYLRAAKKYRENIRLAMSLHTTVTSVVLSAFICSGLIAVRRPRPLPGPSHRSRPQFGHSFPPLLCTLEAKESFG